MAERTFIFTYINSVYLLYLRERRVKIKCGFSLPFRNAIIIIRSTTTFKIIKT